MKLPEEIATRLAEWSSCGRSSPEAVVRAAAGRQGDLEPFRGDLERVLAAEKFLIVEVEAAEHRFAAAGFVAACLGGFSSQAAGPLGGEVTEVVTSTYFDHNLAWHTDSTSWEMPNRWQILTLVQADKWHRPAPTSVIRAASLLSDLEPASLAELAECRFGWREQFPQLPQFQQPILGPVVRWLRPALANYLDSSGVSEIQSLADLAAAVAAARGTDIELDEHRIVVFDNHAVLHRGPHLNPDGGRTVLRLKLGGRVGELGHAA